MRPVQLGDWVTADGANLWIVDSGLKRRRHGDRRRGRHGCSPARRSSSGAGPGAPRRAAGQGCACARGEVLSAGAGHVLALLHRPSDLRGGDLGHRGARRPRRDAHAADRAISGDRAAGRHRAGGLPRSVRRRDRADGRGAAGERDQRRGGHAVHELAVQRERQRADPGHVRDRDQRRPGDDQRQQSREAGRAAAAARSQAPGRHRRARQLVVPAGAGVLRARRPLRRSVHVELRDAQRPRRAEAPAGHDQRPDLRREGLRDADLGEAGPADAVEAHAGRRGQCHHRAERPVRGGQGRAGAERRQAGPRLHDHHQGPPRRRQGVRQHHRPRQSRRLHGAALRRRARRARHRRTTSSSAATTAGRRPSSASSSRRARTPSTSRSA